MKITKNSIAFILIFSLSYINNTYSSIPNNCKNLLDEDKLENIEGKLEDIIDKKMSHATKIIGIAGISTTIVTYTILQYYFNSINDKFDNMEHLHNKTKNQ